MQKRREVSTRALLAVLAFVLGLGTIPHRVCERDAEAFFDGRAREVDALASSVADWTITRRSSGSSFSTGSSRFDGEWQLITYAMASIGFSQVAIERPETKAWSVARSEACLDRLLAPETRAFDREAWGEDALARAVDEHGAASRGHVGYLGYVGLALALHRFVATDSRFLADEARFTATLAARFADSPYGFIETYPGEVYPVDNAAGLAALAIHAKTTHEPPAPGLTRGIEAILRAIDPTTGLLAQSVVPSGRDFARVSPRGSGSALAAYLLAFADGPTSAVLFRAVRTELFRTVIGFGGVLEHADGASRGDVDSGPVVFGFGVSATGFALGASRAHGDRDAFRALYATAHLFGAPFDEGRSRTYATGGPLGDAILFAMMTAPRAGSLS